MLPQKDRQLGSAVESEGLNLLAKGGMFVVTISKHQVLNVNAQFGVFSQSIQLDSNRIKFYSYSYSGQWFQMCLLFMESINPRVFGIYRSRGM